MIKTNKFAIFILTHGRPNSQITLKTLKKLNCTADIYLVIDIEDKTADKYKKIYKDRVILFDKKDIAGKFDIMDNFSGMNTVVFARNILNSIAKEMGIDYYWVLDDDYVKFDFRITGDYEYPHGAWIIKDIDPIINSLLDFYKNTKITSIALSQGGDWIGGNSFKKYPAKRKVMNSFVFSTHRPYYFLGRINEDTNMYVELGKLGYIFLQIPFASLTQFATQKNEGGLTNFYLDTGTYIKSFYTVIINPAAVTINLMGNVNYRLHHSISWDNTCPKILDEGYKKVANV